MFNRSDNFKMNAMQTDFDNLWEYLFKGEFDEYYKIYDRVMTAKFSSEENEVRYPIRVFFKGVEYRTSRAMDKSMNLKEVISEVFPNALENGEFKEKFKNVDVSVSGIKQAAGVTLKYLYDLFCNPDGYLYLVVSV